MKPKRTKRPLKTTLGTAPRGEEPEGPRDESILQRPMQTSVFGLRQVLTLLTTATDEVKDYVSTECDVLYECRVCRALFRSLANFILHKRKYCTERFSVRKRATDECHDDSATGREVERRSPNDISPLDAIVRKLKEKQDVDRSIDEMMEEDLSVEEERGTMKRSAVESERIETNRHAMFQCGIKPEVMEICDILDNNEAIIGPDGKWRSGSDRPIRCKECGQKFGTRKTLEYHVKYKHNGSRLVYSCPDCGETYASAWSVYRHLHKVHRKSMAQIRKLRSQICNNAIRRDEEVRRRRDEGPEAADNGNDDVENQWLADIETDSYFQMCGGCGRRFERKAALQSHTHTCLKRQQVCQSIQSNNNNNSSSNNKRRSEENNNNNKMAAAKPSPKRKRKGSAKRKSGGSVRRRVDEEAAPSVEDDAEVAPSVGDDVDGVVKEEVFDIIGHDIVDEEEVVTTFDHFEPTPDPLLRRSFPYIDTRLLTCLGCPSAPAPPYRTLAGLLRHMSLHFHWYRFQCRLCRYVSYDWDDCEAHAVAAHARETSSMVLPLPQWKSEAMARKGCGRIADAADVTGGASGFCAEDDESDDDDDDNEEEEEEEESSNSAEVIVIEEDQPDVIFGDQSDDVAAVQQIVDSEPTPTKVAPLETLQEPESIADIDLPSDPDRHTVEPPAVPYVEPCRRVSPALDDLKRDDFVRDCPIDDSWELLGPTRGPDLIVRLTKAKVEEGAKESRPKRTVKRSSKVCFEDFEYGFEALNKALRGPVGRKMAKKNVNLNSDK